MDKFISWFPLLLLVAASSSSGAQAVCDAGDRSALLAFQSHGFDPKGFAIPQWNPNTTDCCAWEGITCTSSGRVNTLDLPNASGYVQDISPSVCKLSELVSLRLASFGSINGTIPRCIGTSLLKLRRLNLGNNRLVGKIPPQLGLLTRLTYLDLGQNNFDGAIPTEFCNLKQLQYLDLSRGFAESTDRRSKGSIPECLGALRGLKVLDIKYLKLSGSIPASLGNLTALERLRLDGNDFTGPIPASLGKLTRLKEFYLAGMRITGEMPASLANLVNIQDLYFENLGSLGGKLPDLSGFTKAFRIKITDSKISGTIPAIKGKFPVLDSLYLSGNQLTGGIPTNLASAAPNLTLLYLDNNHLTGTIPASLGSLKLFDFGVSNNSLTGKIPNFLAKFGEVRFEGNPGLCGAPLKRSCPK